MCIITIAKLLVAKYSEGYYFGSHKKQFIQFLSQETVEVICTLSLIFNYHVDPDYYKRFNQLLQLFHLTMGHRVYKNRNARGMGLMIKQILVLFPHNTHCITNDTFSEVFLYIKEKLKLFIANI